MKNWLFAIGGGVIIGAAVWLIVIFAPQVLLFLEGIVGIAAGVVGGIVLVIGVSGVRSNIEERRKEQPKTAQADSSEGGLRE